MDLRIDFIYEEMGATVVSSMFQEALLLGISVVLFSYLRKAFRDQINRTRLVKDLILLFSLMLFCTYVDVSYQVDMGESERKLTFEKAPDSEAAPSKDSTLHSAAFQNTASGPSPQKDLSQIIYRGKWLVVCMLPFDLLTLLIIIGMFVVILLERTPQIFEKKDPSYDLIYQIGLLLLLTAAWHLVVVFWWITWYTITGDWSGWEEDILYHSGFVAFDLVCFLAWRYVLLRRLNLQNRNRLEWVAVLSYSFILITVYASRLVIYVDKLVEGMGAVH